MPILSRPRDVALIRVADDHVQPAIEIGHRVWLVPRVDDGPFESRLQADLDLEEVRPLGDLEPGGCRVLADANPARATHHLAGHEERDEVVADVGERRRPGHQVVLVGAI